MTEYKKNLNTSDIITLFGRYTGLNPSDSKYCVLLLINIIRSGLYHNQNIKLRLLGRFRRVHCSNNKSYDFINHKIVTNPYDRISFQASGKFKKLINEKNKKNH